MMSEKVEKSMADRTGLEDVTRSIRGLLRMARRLGESTADVAERELAMAIRISEQIRDNIISEKALERARNERLSAQLRQDARRVVDLVADAGSLVFVSMLDFLENFADEDRPSLASEANRDQTQS
jgi:hypothetical protein